MPVCFTSRIAWGAASCVAGAVREALLVVLPSALTVGAVGFVVAVVGASSGAAVLDAPHPAWSAGPADPAMQGAPPADPNVGAAAAPGVLIFSKTAGFRHDSIEAGVAALKELLAPTWRLEATEDASAFTTEHLAGFRVVIFLNTTGDVLDDAQQQAFERFVEGGGGFVGIHAAADTEYEWPWYGTLVGAYFKSHPAVQKATVRTEAKEHPSMAGWPAELTRRDEWYDYRSNPRTAKGMLILASLDESSYTGGGMNGDHPTAWCHEVGKGRAFYTGGGHTKEAFGEPLFRSHLKGGVEWAGRLQQEKP